MVLGLDGLDHKLTERLLAEGKLPHLAALREQGDFKSLASTLPPISPVAWSSFQTGVNPGKHNIFDFLTPDERTYQPKLSSAEIRSTRRTLGWGLLRWPGSKAAVRMLRRSRPFWSILGDDGVFSCILRVPVTFPAEPLRGVLLSAMCVPDLRGTQGTFSRYTTRSTPASKRTGGEVHHVQRAGSSVACELLGPPHPSDPARSPLKLPFTVTCHPAAGAELKISGQIYRLLPGEYTDWIPVDFRAGLGRTVRGICRFLLRETEPEFDLYVTPENIDPEHPAMAIGYPAVYPIYLAKRQGSYPPSPSQYGYHRCLCGMGTPDLMGTYGTYQHFSEAAPKADAETGGGQQTRLVFDGDTARVSLVGPENSFLKAPQPTTIELMIHRDRRANAALLEVQGRKLLLRAGQWSPWTKLDFGLSTPACLPPEHVSGICRFYLQEVAPNLRMYVTPINADPTQPAVKLSEPARFVQDVSERLGLFYTTGFQEDHKARAHGVFDDSEFLRQATMVLDERLALLEYALENYDDGFLFFYFSSSDLQSHLFWWDSDEPHPTRSAPQAKQYFRHIQQLYQRLDAVVGDIHQRYGGNAAIFVISDHGFANFGRQFNLNSWLRNGGLLQPAGCSSILQDADWSQTRAYGLGINGLYLNLKGRERDGIVEPGEEQEQLTRQLIAGLQAVRDGNGQQVIRQVYRTDKLYSGLATELAPDLIVGYARGYRASWETCLGELTPEVLSDNPSAWSADHCADASVIPGVLCCNRPIRVAGPALTDLAPTILAELGLPTPSTMTGRTLTVS